ncbi:taste receptor type 1 member 3 [Hypomesus transpacificus]|uniref:taste receptor type 1 member 3 n=1 Tax=Hypomesus transpacificus TaxID=137520 RepID=UPI001F07D12E|nr:taste receptor type 1 member 3 [Hypomesus transpacificus]
MGALLGLLLALCWLSGPGWTQSQPTWFQNISTNLFKETGDIMLGGLFPINQLTSNLSQRDEPNHIECRRINEEGLGLALVMKYTVNEINANSDLLPGVKLGYEIYDTCKQSDVIVKPTLLFLTEGSSRKLAIRCNYTNYETRVVAVIGPSISEMASITGKMLGFFLMPQISYRATSDRLSDKQLYPSFLRTVPSDKLQAGAIVQLLLRFEWNWVAVVGSGEDYGRQGLRLLSTIATDSAICVAYEGLIPVYSDPESEINLILDHITSSKVKVVVVFALAESTAAFFKEVIRRNMTGVWVASTAWALHKAVSSLPGINTVGTILAFTDEIEPVALLTNYTQEFLWKFSEERATQASPSLDSETTSDMQSFSNPCPECWSLSVANLSIVTDNQVQKAAFSVYAAVYSVAHGLHKMLGCNSTKCQWNTQTKIYPWKLLEDLKKVYFKLNGNDIKFDTEGNPSTGYDLIQWVWVNMSLRFADIGTFKQNLSINQSLIQWYTTNSQVPVSTCSSECANGQVRRVKGFHSCCYDCIDCGPGTYQKNKEDIQCTKCPVGQWSLKSSTNCTEPTFEYLTWVEPASLCLMLGMALLLGCQGLAGVLFLQHRDTPMVSASGGALWGLSLLSLAGGCVSLLLFLGQPGDLVCRLQLPLTCIFHTISLATILTISLQIVYVTEFPQNAPSHLGMMRSLGSWLLVLACSGVQAGLIGMFIQTVPSLSNHMENMEVTFVVTFQPCPTEPIIAFGMMQGFNVLLALISFMCTFMAVKPVHQYNLARDITFSTIIYCVVWVAFIPTYTAFQLKGQSIAHVTVSLLSNMGLVGAYCFPKCHLLVKKPDLNKPDHFRTFLEGTSPNQQEEQQNQQ